jgi:hypothetical protein
MGKFAQYMLDRHVSPPQKVEADAAHLIVVVALFFIVATLGCEARLSGALSGGVAI